MTSHYSSVNEAAALLNMSDSLGALNMVQAATSSYKALEQVLANTVALLNAAHNELNVSKNEVSELQAKLNEMETIATTDMLTGLKNRRGFEDNFARELDRTSRGKSVGGVLVIIDLDSFKAINDTYGHQAGDACLKLVGKTLAEEIRVMDTACRLGGDEFVLLMTDSTPELLLTRVQNIAWKLNHLSLPWNDMNIAINASVGMKPYQSGDTAEAVFAEADQHLYADKKRARPMAG